MRTVIQSEAGKLRPRSIGKGCYQFSTDAANAETYKQAYISYVKYVINLVGPKYLSPGIEINIPFTQCPAQKSAWIAWYTGVHNAIAAAYPSLVVFPTFQMEHMYGITNAETACAAGVTLAACFDLRLAEALTIPGDRMAFSTYPISWEYQDYYSHSYPKDTYARVKSATTRKIWVSETGWAAVKILASYPHGANGSCGAELFPASTNDTGLGNYLSWLLAEAEKQKMEAVIWWLNRDYLDGAVAATCPCAPANSDTCLLSDAFYNVDPVSGELLMRIFGNMALHYYDGGARPAYGVWSDYYARRLAPN